MIEKRIIRPHVFTLFALLGPTIPLLLLPLFRELTQWQGGTLSQFVRAEIMVLLALFLVAWLRVRRMQLMIEEGMISLKTGLFLQKKAQVPLQSVSSVSVYRSLAMRLLGCTRLSIDTEGGTRKKADFTLYLCPRDAQLILDRAIPLKGRPLCDCANHGAVALMSALFSSSATGWLVAAPVFSRFVQLLGEGLSNWLYVTVSRFAAPIEQFAGPLSGVLAILLLGGWLLSALLLFFRNFKFCSYRYQNALCLRAGFFARRSLFFCIEDCKAVFLRQPAPMLLTGMSSAHLLVTGYGKEKGELPVLKPCLLTRQNRDLVTLLFQNQPCRAHIRLPQRALWRLFVKPGWIILIFGTLALAGSFFIDYFLRLWLFICATGAAVALVLACVRFTLYRRGGVECSERVVQITTVRRFTLFTAVARWENIGVTSITQDPFQKNAGLCTLHLSFAGESGYRVSLPWMDVKQAGELLQLLHNEKAGCFLEEFHELPFQFHK